MKVIDLKGKRFGRLTVIEQSPSQKNRAMWLCKCDCGNTKIVVGKNLRKGLTQSCGCLQHEKMLEKNIIHGMSKTRLHKEWRGIKLRCTCKTNHEYEYYGGRGIKICPEWENNFENFKNWAHENGYSEELTIDRIDVNGNYEPDNCRWVDKKIQARNRRTRSTNKTGIAGVAKRKDRNSYRVTIGYDGKNHNVGNYKTFSEAVKARKEAELKYWGFTNIK